MLSGSSLGETRLLTVRSFYERLRSATVSLMLLSCCGANNLTTDEAASESADVILSRARDVVSNEACSSRLIYVITVSAVIDGITVQRHYRAEYSGDPDFLQVSHFSDEELATPTVPHGTNFAVTFFAGMGGSSGEQKSVNGLSRAITEKLNHDPPPQDILGIPDLKPFYTFGLRRRAMPNNAPIHESSTSDFRIIGTSKAVRRDYAVALTGVETLDAHQTYHLHLVPLREPSKYRLREVWVDKTSYALWRVVTAGNFVAGPPTRSGWMTTYQVSPAGCRYIDRETALETLDYGRNRKYAHTTLTFSLINDPKAYRLPELMFRRPEDSDDVIEPDE
jgi:hypothetical protein